MQCWSNYLGRSNVCLVWVGLIFESDGRLGCIYLTVTLLVIIYEIYNWNSDSLI